MSRLFAGLQIALLAVALTVHVGDRVTFVNDDDEAHTVTATDKSFDSEGLDTAGTWQHVLPSVLAYRSVEIARNAATITDHSLQT